MKLKIIFFIIATICIFLLFQISVALDEISFFVLFGVSAVILWLYNFFHMHADDYIISEFYDKFMYFTGIVMLLELWVLYTGGAESPLIIFFYIPVVWVVIVSGSRWEEELFFMTFLVFIYTLNFSQIVIFHFAKNFISLCFFYSALKFLSYAGIFGNFKK